MNKKILTGALAALTLGGALAAATTPAAAYDRGGHGGYYRGGYGRGGYGRGYGVGAAALTGLAVGAALAGGAYGPAYYGAPCRIEMRWNPYWGNYERLRVCY